MRPDRRLRAALGPSPIFLNLRLDNLSHAEVINRLFQMNWSSSYSYLVTPNIDHLLKLLQAGGAPTRADYSGADLVICDSRVVELLGSLVDKHIVAYPGADIVKDLLSSHPARPYLVGVVGPTVEQVGLLTERFPAWRFVHYPAPMMQINSPAFNAAVATALVGEWDFLLICLGFPKQEAFAAALRRQGRRAGTAMCVGASVDFLVGTQKRAPDFMQRARLEWLHRLAHNPRRLWRRYLYEGPRILYYYVKIELLRRAHLDQADDGSVP